MSAALRLYVPLYSYCSLHADFMCKEKKQYTVTLNYHAIIKYVPTTNMPLSCHIFATWPNYTVCTNGGVCQNIFSINSQASIMWWGVLCTKGNGGNTESDDDTAQLHKLRLAKSKNYYKSVALRPPHPPKVNIILHQYFQDYCILPKWRLLKISTFKITTSSHSKNG